MLSVQRIVVRGFVCSAPLWLGQHTHTSKGIGGMVNVSSQIVCVCVCGVQARISISGSCVPECSSNT